MYADLQVSFGAILDNVSRQMKMRCAAFVVDLSISPLRVLSYCSRGLSSESCRCMLADLPTVAGGIVLPTVDRLSECGSVVQNGTHLYALRGRRGPIAAMIGMYAADSNRLLPFLSAPEFVRECLRVMDSHLLCASAARKQMGIDFLGFSEVFKRLDAEVRLAARSGAPVLITGERGVGKECIAYAIHHYSKRAAKPFIPINCAALSRELYLSELFGHCRGAFTNATADREGKFHAANQGTLFLDELADLPTDLQIGLQRALDHGEIQRVGSDKIHFVDVRICAATNKDIDNMVSAGAFPADLFDRLNVFRIHVPPLRERKDDIPLLLKYFSSKCCSQFRSESVCDECLYSDVQHCLSDSSLELLINYHWPGNIRELKNVVLRSMARSAGREIKFEPSQEGTLQVAVGDQHHWNYNDAVRQLFLDALEATRWNKSAAARLLGLPLSTMIDKMRRHGVPQSRPLGRAR
jgi:transcriptional regulator with GAF, ATPase, and Fis domain